MGRLVQPDEVGPGSALTPAPTARDPRSSASRTKWTLCSILFLPGHWQSLPGFSWAEPGVCPHRHWPSQHCCLSNNPNLCHCSHPGKSPGTPILLSSICPLPLSHVPGCSDLSWYSGTTQGSWQLRGSVPGPQRPEPTPGHGNVPGAAPAALIARASAGPVKGARGKPDEPRRAGTRAL